MLTLHGSACLAKGRGARFRTSSECRSSSSSSSSNISFSSSQANQTHFLDSSNSRSSGSTVQSPPTLSEPSLTDPVTSLYSPATPTSASGVPSHFFDSATDAELARGGETPALATPVSSAAADDSVSKYVSLYSLPIREKIIHIIPCIFVGGSFGQNDRYAPSLTFCIHERRST
jgi:hypothetical protein